MNFHSFIWFVLSFTFGQMFAYRDERRGGRQEKFLFENICCLLNLRHYGGSKNGTNLLPFILFFVFGNVLMVRNSECLTVTSNRSLLSAGLFVCLYFAWNITFCCVNDIIERITIRIWVLLLLAVVFSRRLRLVAAFFKHSEIFDFKVRLFNWTNTKQWTAVKGLGGLWMNFHDNSSSYS